MTDLPKELPPELPKYEPPKPAEFYEKEGPVPHEPTVHKIHHLQMKPREEPLKSEFSGVEPASIKPNIVLERDNIAPFPKPPKIMDRFSEFDDEGKYYHIARLIGKEPPINTLEKAQHIELPPKEGPYEPDEDHIERFNIPKLEEYNAGKEERERQLLLTEQFLRPDRKMVLKKLKAFLESLPPDELNKRMIETGMGELVVFTDTQVHSARKITFAEAVEILKQDAFRLTFIIKQHDRPTKAQVHNLITSSSYSERHFNPKYIVANLTHEDLNADSSRVSHIGYINENSINSVARAFEDDTDFKRLRDDESGSLFDLQSFYDSYQENARNVMLRSILIALNYDLPDWFTKNVEIKMRFIENTWELLREIRQADGEDELFDFGDEVVIQRYEKMTAELDLYKKDVANPISVQKLDMKNSSPNELYPNVEMNYQGQVEELFAVQSREQLKQLNFDQRKIVLSSGYVVQLQLGQSYYPVTPRVSQAIREGKKSPLFYLKGLLLTHPNHPDMEITIDFDNLSRDEHLPEHEIKRNLSKPGYILTERISKIYIRATEQFMANSKSKFKLVERPIEDDEQDVDAS